MYHTLSHHRPGKKKKKDYECRATYSILDPHPSHFQFLVSLVNYIFKTHFESDVVYNISTLFKCLYNKVAFWKSLPKS